MWCHLGLLANERARDRLFDLMPLMPLHWKHWKINVATFEFGVSLHWHAVIYETHRFFGIPVFYEFGLAITACRSPSVTYITACWWMRGNRVFTHSPLAMQCFNNVLTPFYCLLSVFPYAFYCLGTMSSIICTIPWKSSILTQSWHIFLFRRIIYNILD